MGARDSQSALRIVCVYALISGLWIVASDRLLEVFIQNPIWQARLQTLKGWGFVLVTTGLLYSLIRSNQRQIRRNSELLQAIIDGTTDAIFVKDTQGRYLLVNRASEEILGHPAKDILGRDDRAFLPGQVAEEIGHTDRQIMASCQLQQLEETVPTRGETRIYWSTKYAWRNEQGLVQGLIGMARDLTAYKQLQTEHQNLIESLQQQTQELQALNLITANAISTLDLDELLELLLERILAVTGAVAALIFLNGHHTLQVRASKGTVNAATVNYDAVQGAGFAGIVFSSRQPLYVADDRQDGRFQDLALADQPARTLLGVPLKRQDHCLGVLQLEWVAIHPYVPREMHLVEITAERCTMAILNAQLYEQACRLRDRLQLQIDHLPIGLLVQDSQHRIVDWNPAAETIFGYTKAEVLGKYPSEVIVPAAAQTAFQSFLDQLTHNTSVQQRHCENLTKAGRLIFCEWHYTPLLLAHESFTGILAMVQDVTERKQAQEQLERLAFYDPLTGLPRRRLLLQRLTELLDAASVDTANQAGLFAILHLNCDRFQPIKYALGHTIANNLLIAIARRLEASVLPPALVAHLEADEFVVLLEQLSDHHEAIRWANILGHELRRSFDLDGHQLFITTQIGITLSSQRHASAEACLQAADVAMHQVKRIGPGWALYQETMTAQAAATLHLDTDLRLALERQQYELFYQPILDLQTQALIGYEALLRWRHPHRGLVSPCEFIPVAEQTGLILSLGEWVLQQACHQCHQWTNRLTTAPPLRISVNLSALQLQQTNLLAQIEGVLKQTSLPPHQLTLEITESALVASGPAIIDLFTLLHSRGIRLVIDDFGTGYSSLSYLHQFPVDGLKIDRSFVRCLETDAQSQAIVRTIMQLADNLNMVVVAEGIETVGQLEHLQQIGCQLGQGYVFSPPIDAVHATQFIDLHRVGPSAP